MQVIETGQGKLTGIAFAGGTEFRGVPFAAAPTGKNRFLGPQPASPWSGVRMANQWPKAVVQDPVPFMGISHIGEEALSLNIWVPDADGPMPVMLWFHGGGYLTGSPSQPLYNAQVLARDQGVIVVAASYRLGFCGFGHLDAQRTGLDIESNRGLRDQVAALRWVVDNIAAFGGDPGCITLFGESAGGFSVASLMACPQAQGLFQQAIVQSGAADMVLAQDEGLRIADAVIDALPGSGAAADRLLSASAEDLCRAQRKVLAQSVCRGLRTSTPQYGMVFMPVVDGETLTASPVASIASGSSRKVRLLAGVCRDEWHLFAYAQPFNGGKSLADLRALTEEDLHKRFQRTLPEHWESAWAYYSHQVVPHPQRGRLDWFSAMESDRLFRVPTQRLLDAHASAGGLCWGFEFTWGSHAFGVPLGACHVVDVPFVFRGTDTPIGQLFTGGGEAADQLAVRVGQVWGHVAKGNHPDWAEWSRGSMLHTFGREEGETTLLCDNGNRLWQEIIPPAKAASKARGSV